jgi:hydroxymethylpyrimidine pyrophosphatase-like HAD family hydrolase
LRQVGVRSNGPALTFHPELLGEYSFFAGIKINYQKYALKDDILEALFFLGYNGRSVYEQNGFYLFYKDWGSNQVRTKILTLEKNLTFRINYINVEMDRQYTASAEECPKY